MGLPHQTLAQMNGVITRLIQIGLANDQNFGVIRALDGHRTEVTFKGADYIGMGLRNDSYADTYDGLRMERAFSVLLPDGAMLQLSYRFYEDELVKHRLAFWPSPHLDQFQNDPDIYLEDCVFAEVVSRRIVPFPIRFDHDSDEQVYKEIDHPISHLTLGQYENCRIPLSAPLPPAHFVDFVLRNFYHTAFCRYAEQLPNVSSPYSECISDDERNLIHLKVPGTIHRTLRAN